MTKYSHTGDVEYEHYEPSNGFGHQYQKKRSTPWNIVLERTLQNVPPDGTKRKNVSYDVFQPMEQSLRTYLTERPSQGGRHPSLDIGSRAGLQR